MTKDTSQRALAGLRRISDVAHGHPQHMVEVSVELFDDFALAPVLAELERLQRIEAAARNGLNALLLTFTNVPADWVPPHWCRQTVGHEATCSGMLRTVAELRAALDGAEV